jgi:GNAT superfamily N-acetyltransferase
MGSRAQPLVEHPAREALTSGVTSLIHQAANPYYDWFFGGASAARAAIERQLEAPSSELSTEGVMLLLDDDGTFAGIFVALGGAELAHARKADALATLAAAASPAERSALMARMAETRHLFAPVRADDFYLSKIAVAERRRGRGWGRGLLEYVGAGAGPSSRVSASTCRGTTRRRSRSIARRASRSSHPGCGRAFGTQR